MFGRRRSVTEAPTDLSYRDSFTQQQQSQPQPSWNGYSSTGSNFSGQLPSLRDAVGSNYGIRPPSPASSIRSSSAYQYGPSPTRPALSPFASPTFPFGSTNSNSMYSASGMPSASIPRRASVSDAFMPSPSMEKKSTRRARRKMAPECCHVCGVQDTPEWRKGPSGLRTLCNACGLVASKLSLPEPTSMNEVIQYMESIGKARYRVGRYPLPAGARERATMSWQPPEVGSTSREFGNAMDDYEAAAFLQSLSGPRSASLSPGFPTPTASSSGFPGFPPALSTSGFSSNSFTSSSTAPILGGMPTPAYPFPISPASPSLERTSRRLSGLSMEETDPSPTSSSGSSSRMDLNSLMNRPSSRNSTRRLSFF